MKTAFRLAVLALLALAAACAPRPPEPDALVLTRAEFRALPGWADDRHGEALTAFRLSCGTITRLPADRPMGPDGVGGVAGDWHGACAAASQVADGDDAAARRFFEAWFVPHRAANRGEAVGLFTGYYEPELKGSKRAGGRYAVPLYGRPADLVMVELGEFRPEWKGQRIAGRVVEGRLKPYESRAEIEAGALRGKASEIVWVDDPVDAFFLHVQGSGRVRLEDGAILRVGYAGQNGHPYVAIGRKLIERGVLTRENVSMQAIRAWLMANPAEGRALMAENPSYVFFRELGGESGPLGAQGVPLTPGRSLAVDRRFVPLGAPVWLDTTDPLAPEALLRRLLVAQDTGGAILGPVRGDVFWGFGAEAAERAGRMKQTGTYWLLLPRPVAERRAATS